MATKAPTAESKTSLSHPDCFISPFQIINEGDPQTCGLCAVSRDCKKVDSWRRKDLRALAKLATVMDNPELLKPDSETG